MEYTSGVMLPVFNRGCSGALECAPFSEGLFHVLASNKSWTNYAEVGLKVAGLLLQHTRSPTGTGRNFLQFTYYQTLKVGL